MNGKERTINIVVCHKCGKEFPAGDWVCPWCHTVNEGNKRSQKTWEYSANLSWERFKWFSITLLFVLSGMIVAAVVGSVGLFILWPLVGGQLFFHFVVKRQPYLKKAEQEIAEQKRVQQTRKYAYPVKSVIITSSSRKSVSSAAGRGIVGGVLGGGVGSMVGLMSGKEIETVTFRVWWNDGHQTTEQVLVGSVDYQRFMQVLN